MSDERHRQTFFPLTTEIHFEYRAVYALHSPTLLDTFLALFLFAFQPLNRPHTLPLHTCSCLRSPTTHLYAPEYSPPTRSDRSQTSHCWYILAILLHSDFLVWLFAFPLLPTLSSQLFPLQLRIVYFISVVYTNSFATLRTIDVFKLIVTPRKFRR